MPKQNKILFVDDTKMFQSIYKSKLMSEGYEVKTADNGLEAIKSLSEEKPDLILLDLNMPVMDGFKVLQAVKANPIFSSIPVIIFSSRGQAEEIEKAVNLGADGYLVKTTTTPNEVVKKVKEVLNK
ncbi:MAG: response regulator [Thermodesulfovibrionia bacterium]|nr:response regulator [Thermodesulfovibrionia bacterium]